MESPAEAAVQVGELPIQYMIPGVEEVLRLAGPVEEQLSQLFREKEEIAVKYQALQVESEQLRKENSVLKSSGNETVQNVFKSVEHELDMARKELIRIEGSKNQRINELVQERGTILAELKQLKILFEEQNGDLKAIREEKGYLEERAANQHQDIHSLEQEKQEMHAELEHVQTTVKEQNDQVRKLTKDKEALEETVASHEEQLRDLDEHRRTILSELKELQTKNEELNGKLRVILEEKCSLKASVTIQRQQLDSSEEEMIEMRSHLGKAQATVKELEDQLTTLLTEKDGLEETVSNQGLELKQMLSLEEERQTLQSILQQLQKKYEEQNEKLILMRKKNCALDVLVSTQRQEMSSSEKEKEDMRSKFEKGSDGQQILSIVEEKRMIQSELEQMQKKNEEHSNHLKIIREEKDALEKRVANQRQQLSSFEKERQTMRTELQNRQTTSEELNVQLQNVRKENDELDTTIASKISAFGEERERLQNELEQLNKNNDLQNEQLRAITDNKRTLEDVVDAQRQQMSSVEKQMHAIRTELETSREQYDRIQTLIAERDVLQATITSQLQQLSCLEKKRQTMRTELQNRQTTSEELNVQLQKVRKEKDELDTTIASKISAFGEERERLQNELEQQISAFGEERDRLQNELEQLNKNYDLQNEQLRAITDNKRTLEDVVDTQRQQMSSVEKEMHAIRTELETAQATSREQYDQLQTLIAERDVLQATNASQIQTMGANELYYTEQYEFYVNENEQLNIQLSAMQADKANWCVDHDPMIIAELYKKVYTKLWPEAFEKAKTLSVTRDAKNGVKTMIECVEMVNTFCATEFDDMKRNLEETLRRESADEDFLDEATVLQRITSGTSELALGLLYQAFQKSLNSGFQVHKFANASPVFVRECIRIFWLMNLNEPPIVMQTKNGGDFDENVYEAYTEEGDKVEYVVWPALFHDGSVLAKGVAKCYRSSDIELAARSPTGGQHGMADPDDHDNSSADEGSEGEYGENVPRYDADATSLKKQYTK